MKLEALIRELRGIYDLYGDIPILLSVEALDDDDQDMMVHGDALGVCAEQDHDGEGMFVRINGDGLGEAEAA